MAEATFPMIRTGGTIDHFREFSFDNRPIIFNPITPFTGNHPMPHAITSLLTETETLALEARMRDMLGDMCCSLRKDPVFSGTDSREAKFMIFDSNGEIPMASHGRAFASRANAPVSQ
jgi:hypothetical protein